MIRRILINSSVSYIVQVLEATAVKAIANGQTMNAKSGTFDLQGRRMNAQTARKGVYIVDGRKVIK